MPSPGRRPGRAWRPEAAAPSRQGNRLSCRRTQRPRTGPKAASRRFKTAGSATEPNVSAISGSSSRRVRRRPSSSVARAGSRASQNSSRPTISRRRRRRAGRNSGQRSSEAAAIRRSMTEADTVGSRAANVCAGDQSRPGRAGRGSAGRCRRPSGPPAPSGPARPGTSSPIRRPGVRSGLSSRAVQRGFENGSARCACRQQAPARLRGEVAACVSGQSLRLGQQERLADHCIFQSLYATRSCGASGHAVQQEKPTARHRRAAPDGHRP